MREVLAAAERADNRKAAELLGWKTRYSLDDIVTSAWNRHSLTAGG